MTSRKPGTKARRSEISSNPKEDQSAAPPAFPIVGIGASAGGLEAIELFLKNVPKKSGLAYVIVQHLDPTHKGILAELLQRDTDMPVTQIENGVAVEPDHVYVIPPDRDLSILHGALHLLEPAAARGLRLPIDFFFRSLADDRQEQSIGVILSGMGSDGTLGLRAIKEKAGAVFVQEPASARFDSMPRSAIEAGLADVIAPANELPGKIFDYLQHVPLLINRVPAETDLADKEADLSKIIVLLRAQTGHDFSQYRTNTIARRIERRMGLHQLAKLADYVRYLRENPQEADLLFKELLIGVTSFFRDPDAWNQLKTEAVPALLKARHGGDVLRAWVPGCSTGEEAYSLAIIFLEALEYAQLSQHFTLQIFATDLDKDAIVKARSGAYPSNIASDVSEERLRRYFEQDEHGYQVRKAIREMVIFAPQNLIADPPFTKLDILTCRNLLIYLKPDLQKKLVPLFHFSLNPGGLLFLGSAESVGSATDLFAGIPGQNRLFRRLDSTLRADQLSFPSASLRTRPAAETLISPDTPVHVLNLQSLADRFILQRFAPAAVLVTEGGDILYVNGKTGKYLEPAAGKANWNLLAMAREGLGQPLCEGLRRALREKAAVQFHEIEVGTNGGTQMVDVTIQPLVEPEGLRGMVLVAFTDVPPPAAKRRSKQARGSVDRTQLATLEQELRSKDEELRTTREEMQTALEELRSTNEELQSTNEELQSTNEELTTTKEETQSINEELRTVNHELLAKNNELTTASDDMNNLFDSTDLAVLFLDIELRVRRFTTHTASIFKLIPGDVGRPFTDIVHALDYPALADDARAVLRTLIAQEKDSSASVGRWFKVRIMPYRTQDNRIDGVIITFADITLAKRLEAELRQAQKALEERYSQQRNNSTRHGVQ